MHFRWLRVPAVLAVVCLHCLVVPVMAALKEMDATEFDAFLRQQPSPDTLILIYEEGMPESEEAEATLEQMIAENGIEQHIPGIQVTKQKKGQILSEAHKVTKFPSLVLIRDDITAYYTDLISREDPDILYYWLGNAGPKRVTKLLTDDTFEHLTQASTGSTTGYWLVYFYHLKCMDHTAVIETAAITHRQWLNVATVDLDTNPKLEKRFKITECPELIYFREGKMYRYEMRKWDAASVTSFVETWFRNVKMSSVPTETTSFDILTNNIALYLKSQFEGENRTFTFVIIGGVALSIVAAIIFCCVTGGSDSKHKTE